MALICNPILIQIHQYQPKYSVLTEISVRNIYWYQYWLSLLSPAYHGLGLSLAIFLFVYQQAMTYSPKVAFFLSCPANLWRKHRWRYLKVYIFQHMLYTNICIVSVKTIFKTLRICYVFVLFNQTNILKGEPKKTLITQILFRNHSIRWEITHSKIYL